MVLFNLLKSISISTLSFNTISQNLQLRNLKNKCFFYPIFCKNGGVSIDTIAQELLNPNFSRLIIGISCNSDIKNGPHLSGFPNPLAFYWHDSLYANGTFYGLQKYDLEKFRIINNSITDLFLKTMFNFMIWYVLFEHIKDSNFSDFLHDRNFVFY